jgi:hypothetical protein
MAMQWPSTSCEARSLSLPAFSDLAATARQQGLALAHLAIGCTPMADGRPIEFRVSGLFIKQGG